MAQRSPLSTSILLTCAAIGVASGVLGGIAAWVTPVVIVGAPIIYGFVLGAHAIPGVIAQELLRRPWVALITHGVAALVGTAIAPHLVLSFLGTALLFGGIQELVAAATRYRVWQWWRFFISGAIIGAIAAVAVAFTAHIASMGLWAQITYLVLAVLGPVAWTAVGLWIGASLRRAGVARTAQR